jgi:hypothetical protein
VTERCQAVASRHSKRITGVSTAPRRVCRCGCMTHWPHSSRFVAANPRRPRLPGNHDRSAADAATRWLVVPRRRPRGTRPPPSNRLLRHHERPNRQAPCRLRDCQLRFRRRPGHRRHLHVDQRPRTTDRRGIHDLMDHSRPVGGDRCCCPVVGTCQRHPRELSHRFKSERPDPDQPLTAESPQRGPKGHGTAEARRAQHHQPRHRGPS